MFEFEKIKLDLSYNALYFFLGLVILLIYSFYVYRFTLPPVSVTKKILLTSLRGIALLLLLFIIFEPVLTLTKTNIINPVILFFFDNSKSITIKDGTDRVQKVNDIVSFVSSGSLKGEKQFYKFGKSLSSIDEDSLKNLTFSETSTDFSKIFSGINKIENNISAAVIISDGVITEGTTPIYTAEKLGIPVFTLGIGDSAVKNDLEIKNVVSNEFVYAETPTTVSATILSKGFAGFESRVSLFENSKLIEEKQITFDESGVQTILFDYTPKNSGEKKLSVRIKQIEGESNLLNNQKIFFVNVLSNKINILLVAGSPSADLTFVKTALSTEENFRVNSLTQISNDTFLEDNPISKIDSSDIIFFIHYPVPNINAAVFNRIISKIENKKTPFFTLLSGDVDKNYLAGLSSFLPITIQTIEKNYLQVQPDIQAGEISNPILNNNSTAEWNNLPPISHPISLITIKPESKIISKVRISNQPKNMPLIVSRNIGSERSIAVIGKDIWRWKLQTAGKNLSLFDNFIISSARWLNAPYDQRKVKIKSSKKLYSKGEVIEFSAQVYDESFNPINDAQLNVLISGKDYKEEISLNSIGFGLYEGSIPINKNGDFTYSGKVQQNNKKIGEDFGSFNIGDLDIELFDARMNFQFLSNLSEKTNGRFFTPSNINELINILNQITDNTRKEKIISSETRLWSNELLLIILVMVFAIEWFLRKRAGML